MTQNFVQKNSNPWNELEDPLMKMPEPLPFFVDSRKPTKRQSTKLQRNSGSKYKAWDNAKKTVPARQCKFLILKCRFRCNQNFNENATEAIFNYYWKEHKNIDFRRSFIAQFVLQKNPSNKQYSWREYFFPIQFASKFQSEGTKKVQVCRKHFLATLNETQSFINYTLGNKIDIAGVWPLTDNRGKHRPSHALTLFPALLPAMSIQKGPSMIDVTVSGGGVSKCVRLRYRGGSRCVTTICCLLSACSNICHDQRISPF